MGVLFFCYECKFTKWHSTEHQTDKRPNSLTHLVLIIATIQSIFGEQSYNKPFLITYVNTASFSFYLLPFLLKKKLSNRKANHVDELRYVSSTDFMVEILITYTKYLVRWCKQSVSVPVCSVIALQTTMRLVFLTKLLLSDRASAIDFNGS
jgi:hydrogenase-4 membrane subunit HyfE